MHFVIDGNNVAFHLRTKKPELNPLLVLIQRIQEVGSVFPVVSSELKFRIDDPKTLQKNISEQKIHETPPNTDSDHFILEMAAQLNAYLVSNDQFKEHRSLYSNIITRRCSFMLVRMPNGEIMTILPWIHHIIEKAEVNNADLPTKLEERGTIEESS
jgi:hypothetical protein